MRVRPSGRAAMKRLLAGPHDMAEPAEPPPGPPPRRSPPPLGPRVVPKARPTPRSAPPPAPASPPARASPLARRGLARQQREKHQRLWEEVGPADEVVPPWRTTEAPPVPFNAFPNSAPQPRTRPSPRTPPRGPIVVTPAAPLLAPPPLVPMSQRGSAAGAMPPVPMEGAVALCRELLRPLFVSVGLEQLVGGHAEVTEMDGGPLVRLELRAHMWQPPKLDPVNSLNSYFFRGWHGTRCAAAASILAHGGVQAIPPPVGTGLVFLRAAPCPRPWEVRRLIGDVSKSAFGYHGLAFELECAPRRRIRLSAPADTTRNGRRRSRAERRRAGSDGPSRRI